MVSHKINFKESEEYKIKNSLKPFINDKDYKKKDVRFIGVVLPIEIYNELESIAREEDRRVSQIVRLAIRRYLKERRDAQVKE